MPHAERPLRVNGNAEVGDRERRGAGEGLGTGLDGLENLGSRDALVLLEVLCEGPQSEGCGRLRAYSRGVPKNSLMSALKLLMFPLAETKEIVCQLEFGPDQRFQV